MNKITFEGLRCHYQTGRSYVVSSEGRKRVYGYRHGMTDLEYDLLTDELLKLETETGQVLSGSPTQKVSGEILEEPTPVRHTKPMLSAKKTKSIEDLVRFSDHRSVLVSWKLDGLTIVLRYENGELKQAITRGREGIIGEDVTHTVRTYLNVPLTIPIQEPIEVRGEGVISWQHFPAYQFRSGGTLLPPQKSGGRQHEKAGRK